MGKGKLRELGFLVYNLKVRIYGKVEIGFASGFEARSREKDN